ncbi:hypothetical protein LCGC14_1800360 [marine sediment metagenome]|uniref:site-specific DNA-methyltransferase (cytosine-N(4)-specific) n=1 Tax=marine sediment metagenome TaxID=412755 RepID=A0A0F9HCK7_9ZZZZ
MSRAALYVGDVLEVLRTLPDESVQCCVTSPPYWGLRSYGTPPQIWDGDDECEHSWGDDVRVLATNHVDQRRWQHTRNGRDEEQPLEKRVGWKRHSIGQGAWCQICGAWRGELGLEPTPQLYVEHLVRIFREVRRVLRPDATLWLNLGDCYATGAGKVGDHPGSGEQGSLWAGRPPKGATSSAGFRGQNSKHDLAKGNIGPMTQPNRLPIEGLKPKDLVMMPARIALALQADGWWVRSDIIWSKPNPMPESVRDRPTRSHEYVFLLSKSRRYFYDADAIAEPLVTNGQPNAPDAIKSPHGQGFSRRAQEGKVPSGWDTRAGGHREKKGRYASGNKERKSEPYRRSNVGSSIPWEDETGTRNARSVWTISTTPYPGAHFATFPPKLAERCIKAGSRPGDTVLDPFGGSGTTAAVATGLGRNAIHIDLNPEYTELAVQRIGPMLVDVKGVTA